ncbi:flippase-like domain-containing protein [bacterium]|nr:flippase-like domain-containing protein [bacterium]
MKKRKIFALLITITFLVLIFHKLDFSKLVETFKDFDFKNIWGIIIFYTIAMYLRGYRWKYLLLGDKKYNPIHLGNLFIVGTMLNIFLPARAGDIYRAYYLGETKQEKKMKMFGNIILERTLDGICVFLILLAAVLMYCKQAWILNIAYMIGAIFIGSFIAFYLMFKFNKVDFICDKLIGWSQRLPQKLSGFCIRVLEALKGHINSFMEGFEVLDSVKFTSFSFLSSAVVWALECYVVYLILGSFNLGLSFSASLFVISLISFSTMIPSTSVFLGPYQAAYILALGIYGIDKSSTLAISTIHQMLQMIIITIIGVIYLLKFNLEIKNKKE